MKKYLPKVYLPLFLAREGRAPPPVLFLEGACLKPTCSPQTRFWDHLKSQLPQRPFLKFSRFEKHIVKKPVGISQKKRVWNCAVSVMLLLKQEILC